MVTGEKGRHVNISDKIIKWAEQNLRLIFAILRNTLPNLGFKGIAIVTRFNDVQEVLSRDDAFNVTYGAKMAVLKNGSNFFLGMDPTPIYQRDVSNMRIAIAHTDIETIIIPMSERLTAEQIAKFDHKLYGCLCLSVSFNVSLNSGSFNIIL